MALCCHQVIGQQRWLSFTTKLITCFLDLNDKWVYWSMHVLIFLLINCLASAYIAPCDGEVLKKFNGIQGNESLHNNSSLEDYSNKTDSSSPHPVVRTLEVSAVLNVQVLESTTVNFNSDNGSKILVSITIPFVSIIATAVVLVIIYKLARAYNCCSKACLDACSAFCDTCVSTPYVYQAPAHQSETAAQKFTMRKVVAATQPPTHQSKAHVYTKQNVAKTMQSPTHLKESSAQKYAKHKETGNAKPPSHQEVDPSHNCLGHKAQVKAANSIRQVKQKATLASDKNGDH